jgi:hypothetical protein
VAVIISISKLINGTERAYGLVADCANRRGVGARGIAGCFEISSAKAISTV